MVALQSRVKMFMPKRGNMRDTNRMLTISSQKGLKVNEASRESRSQKKFISGARLGNLKNNIFLYTDELKGRRPQEGDRGCSCSR